MEKKAQISRLTKICWESNVHRRQILTYKDGIRVGRVYMFIRMITFDTYLQRMLNSLAATQPTWDVGPALVYCWTTIYDVGPTVNQRGPNDSWLLDTSLKYFFGPWGRDRSQSSPCWNTLIPPPPQKKKWSNLRLRLWKQTNECINPHLPPLLCGKMKWIGL